MTQSVESLPIETAVPREPGRLRRAAASVGRTAYFFITLGGEWGNPDEPEDFLTIDVQDPDRPSAEFKRIIPDDIWNTDEIGCPSSRMVSSLARAHERHDRELRELDLE